MSRQLRTQVLAVVALAAPAIGQTGIPRRPLDPPALPHDAPRNNFGSTIGPRLNPRVAAPNGSTWTPIGPEPLNAGGGANASGRLVGVAVDPTNSSNIYVAAAGGGVWQTTNGGVSYTPLTDTQTTLSMGAIAIAPSNHLRIYAGTGEANNSGDSNFGRGILVSSDGGATWSLTTGPSGVFSNDKLTVAKISVDPTNANTAYAATSDLGENGLCNGFYCGNTGIYKTTDGATWTNVTAAVGLDSTYAWSDVAVDPNNPSIIYAAHGDLFADNTANGVYRSLNGGSSWSVLSNAPNGNGIGRIALAVAPSASTANQHVLYVAIAAVDKGSSTLYEMLVSNNADATTPTFTNLANTPNFGGNLGEAWYDWIIGVDPANALNAYAAGALNYSNNTHHIIRTTNGGTSWTDITTVGAIEPHTDSHAMAFDSSSRLLLGTDGGLWRFDPAVPSWTNLNGNLNTIQFYGIGLHPTSTQDIIGGSQDNGNEMTTGSVVWNTVAGGDGGFSQFSQTNPLVIYTTESYATVYVSTTGGAPFKSSGPSVSSSNSNFMAPIAVDPSNGNRVLLGANALYETTSAGGSWTSHTSPSANLMDAVALVPGSNTIYISTGGTYATTSQIWISTNDGASWTNRSLPVSGRVNELDLDPGDATGNTVVAVINVFNGAKGQVYRSTSGGVGWTNISANLPQLPTWSAKIDKDPGHTIYVANETGVYSSPSPYTTWNAVGSGLPHAQAIDLELNTSLRLLAVATHGRGAWYITLANPCEVTGDMSPGIADVQKVINEALGHATAADDLNGDKVVNVVDVQIVMNAALSLGCTL